MSTLKNFVATSKDLPATQLALKALDAMNRGASTSGRYLDEAWKANIAAGEQPTDVMKMRRAALARDAYEARVTSEKGRMVAAYALLAAREGTKAITAQQAAQQAQDASQRQVLVDTAKFATLRRNVMLEAAQAAEKSFKVPALAPALQQASSTNQEMSLNRSSLYRPPAWVNRSNTFFPDDVRVAAGAAGALGSLGALPATPWWDAFVQHQAQGVMAGFAEAERAVAPIVAQEPGSAAVAEEAKTLMQTLQPGQVATAQTASSSLIDRLPWWALPVGAAALYYFWK